MYTDIFLFYFFFSLTRKPKFAHRNPEKKTTAYKSKEDFYLFQFHWFTFGHNKIKHDIENAWQVCRWAIAKIALYTQPIIWASITRIIICICCVSLHKHRDREKSKKRQLALKIAIYVRPFVLPSSTFFFLLCALICFFAIYFLCVRNISANV